MNTKPFQSLPAILIFCLGSLSALSADVNLPGPKDAATPDFGPNVLIFDPSMTNIQEQMNAVIARQQRAQFGTNRYAYLFKPGKYELDVQIAYYMHLMGLGRRRMPCRSPARCVPGPRAARWSTSGARWRTSR